MTTYVALLERLAGRERPPICEVCGGDNGGRPMQFDHDHACCATAPRDSCGKCFRGWLCTRCNAARAATIMSTAHKGVPLSRLHRIAIGNAGRGKRQRQHHHRTVCNDCSMISNASGLARHIKKTGHHKEEVA